MLQKPSWLTGPLPRDVICSKSSAVPETVVCLV
jgi:hypothetical protein